MLLMMCMPHIVHDKIPRQLSHYQNYQANRKEWINRLAMLLVHIPYKPQTYSQIRRHWIGIAWYRICAQRRCIHETCAIRVHLCWMHIEWPYRIRVTDISGSSYSCCDCCLHQWRTQRLCAFVSIDRFFQALRRSFILTVTGRVLVFLSRLWWTVFGSVRFVVARAIRLITRWSRCNGLGGRHACCWHCWCYRRN